MLTKYKYSLKLAKREGILMIHNIFWSALAGLVTFAIVAAVLGIAFAVVSIVKYKNTALNR